MASEELLTSVLQGLLTNKDFIHLLQKTINTSLEKISVQVDTNAGAILELQSKIDKLAKEVQESRNELETLRDFKQQAKRDTNNLEQYTRRNSLRIFGIPVTKNENTNEIVKELAATKLHIDLCPGDIDRSHRVGKAENNTRAIIVKFTRHDVKTNFLRARRALKGSRVVIREDLTKTNQDLLKAALASESVSTAWSWDARIYAKLKDTNTVVIIRSQGDVDKL